MPGAGDRSPLPFYHQPVLSNEMLHVFRPAMGKQIFDGTLGGGGHTEMLLEAGAHVIGCDQDSEALDYASARLERFEDQFLPVQQNFGNLDAVFDELGIDKVDGILLDIGVSSRQLDSVIPKRSARNPATKVFQALRIAVNDELGVLETALEKAADRLLPGGSLAVITFHSLEDRIVKQFLKNASKKEIDRPEWPEPRPNPEYRYNLVQRKAIEPSAEEVAANPRSRSAKLRVGVRI